MKVHELLMKFCSYNGIERSDFAKILADLTNDEFEKFAQEVKKLVHHKDTTVGLYAIDSEPGELLHKFWQRSSDACPLECTEAEKQQVDFYDWAIDEFIKIDY